MSDAAPTGTGWPHIWRGTLSAWVIDADERIADTLGDTTPVPAILDYTA
jgi:hypothetical protein